MADPTYNTIIGQVANGTYNMSGAASFVGTVKAVWMGNSANGTWTLTDSANASIAALDFSRGTASQLILSGAAAFSATDLVSLTGANKYISFTTGSTATLTVATKVLADYQAYVTAGNIRVDGVVQTDFSKFQVTDSTLSLSTGGSPPPHLVITSVSPESPSAGTGFDVTVQAQDISNAPANVTADTAVILTLKTGTGTLGGIVSGTIAASSSSITIIGVTYTKAESGVTLTATATSGDSVIPGDSAAFTVVAGAASKLAFGVQPSNTGSGSAISPAVTVLVQDASGNTVTGDTSSVTIACDTTVFAPASVLTMSAVAGVATFSALEPTTDGIHTLTASDGALTGATSSVFTVDIDSVDYWTVTGTQTWTSTSGGFGNGLRMVTGYLCIGYGVGNPGTLNQSAGTITVADPIYNTIIGQVADGTYNMSGAASFVATVKAVWMGNSANGTWTLTDSANASIAALDFGHGTASLLMLSGAATFSATDLVGLAGADKYISFATGSTATLTVANKVLADYQAYVTAGHIRVDGVVQTDFSKFQVTGTGGHTLSLVTGSPYDTWANGYNWLAFTNPDKTPTGNPDGDGLTNLQEYAFGTDPTVSFSGEIVYDATDVTTPGGPKMIEEGGMYYAVFGRRADYLTAGITYTVRFSADLQNGYWVTSADVPEDLTPATTGTIHAVRVPFPGLIDSASGPQKARFFQVGVSAP